MEDFEEQWSRIQLVPFLAEDTPEYYSSTFVGTHDDITLSALVNDNSAPCEAIRIADSETVADDDPMIFEFFDLHKATLNQGGPQSPQLQAHTSVLSTTDFVTAYSPLPRSVTSSAPQGSSNTDPMTGTKHLLQHRSAGYMPHAETVHTPSIAITPTPLHHDSTQVLGNRKRSMHEVPIEAYCSKAGDIPAMKKRRKQTQEQLEDTRKVRAQGPCLRCHVQKSRCSEGLPCTTCKAYFDRARTAKTFGWTSCVSVSLPKLNIFAIANKETLQQKSDVYTASFLYTLLFENELLPNDVVPTKRLYTKVLQCTYGQRAPEVHPFLLQWKDPMSILVQLNVILLGSPMLGTELIGKVRYLQKLRAICAVVAFEGLGRALIRKSLAISSLDRQSALIVQVALLLDQVLQTRGDLPAAALVCARGKLFEEMREHLIQYLSYYLQKLVPDVSGFHNILFECIGRAKLQGHLGGPFWATLSNLMPFIPLKLPPMLRKYADMSWKDCDVESGEALHEYFSSRCNISCK